MELHSTWFRGRTWGSVMGAANTIVPNATVRTRAGSFQKCILNLGDVNHLVRDQFRKFVGPQVVLVVVRYWQYPKVDIITAEANKTKGSRYRLFRIKIGFGSIEAKHSFNIASQKPLHHNQTSCQAGNAYRR